MSKPHTSVNIRGIFYKVDEKNPDKYHFILPNIYHNDNSLCHTLNTLTEFDNKVNKHYEEKINDKIIEKNFKDVKITKPLYKEYGLLKYDKNISFTTFKICSDKKLNLIVGLEYQISAKCISGDFVDQNDSYVIFWNIKTIEIYEAKPI